MAKSTLSAGLKAAAGHAVTQPVPAPQTSQQPISRARSRTVLVGGHFSPEVRRTLLLVQAEQRNEGKNLKQLLGEAINDLCAKYGKPQPYQGEQ